MAHYIPDIKYIDGKKALENLQGEEGELIRYYVSEKDKHSLKVQEKLNEMCVVFDGIRKFTR